MTRLNFEIAGSNFVFPISRLLLLRSVKQSPNYNFCSVINGPREKSSESAGLTSPGKEMGEIKGKSLTPMSFEHTTSASDHGRSTS